MATLGALASNSIDVEKSEEGDSVAMVTWLVPLLVVAVLAAVIVGYVVMHKGDGNDGKSIEMQSTQTFMNVADTPLGVSNPMYDENGANDELYDAVPNTNDNDLANGYQDVAGVGSYEGDEPTYGGDSADYGGYGTPGMQQTNGYADVAAFKKAAPGADDYDDDAGDGYLTVSGANAMDGNDEQTDMDAGLNLNVPAGDASSDESDETDSELDSESEDDENATYGEMDNSDGEAYQEIDESAIAAGEGEAFGGFEG